MAKIIIIQFRKNNNEMEMERKRFNKHFSANEVEYANVCDSSIDWRSPEKILFGKSGAILGGSSFCISRFDRDAELKNIVKTADPILNYILNNGFPCLGICFGHQLLAHRLGARVEYRPENPEAGAVEINIAGPAAPSPLFPGIPNGFLAQMCHKDFVVDVPINSFLMASSKKCPVAGFQIQKNIFGVQFHPEATCENIKKIVLELDTSYQSPDMKFSPSPLAPKILENFLKFAEKIRTNQ